MVSRNRGPNVRCADPHSPRKKSTSRVENAKGLQPGRGGRGRGRNPGRSTGAKLSSPERATQGLHVSGIKYGVPRSPELSMVSPDLGALNGRHKDYMYPELSMVSPDLKVWCPQISDLTRN